jgi:transposase
VAAVRPVERRRDPRQDCSEFAGGVVDQHRLMVHRWDGDSGRALLSRGRKKGDPEEPEDHALGRSRGGFSTKFHLLCDALGHPLCFHLTPGQAHESTTLEAVLETADEELTDSEGCPIAWPVALSGDKAYRADWIDAHLLELGITPVIPSKANEDRDARPVSFDREAYRQRNIVERLIGWLKESRRLFSRFEKTAKNFGGMIKMAFIRRYLGFSGAGAF